MQQQQEQDSRDQRGNIGQGYRCEGCEYYYFVSKWEEVTGKWGVKKEVQEDVILQNITVHVSLGYGGDAERLHDYHYSTSLVNALKHSGVASLCVVTCNHTPPFSNYSLTTGTVESRIVVVGA